MKWTDVMVFIVDKSTLENNLTETSGTGTRHMPNEDPEEFFSRIRDVLETAYLSHDEPWRQSGFSGPEERWVNLRRVVADCIHHDGTFLDIGCANGYLIECCLRWTAERNIRLTPYGIDLSERLVELAKARVPQFADHFYVANAFRWRPSMGFDYVRTELVYVPGEYEKAYIERLLREFLNPGGRLLIANYTENDPGLGFQPGQHPTAHLLERLGDLGFSPIEVRDGFDPVKSRTARIAVLESE